MKKILAAVVLVGALAMTASAQKSPIKVSLWGPIAWPGINAEITGLDVGIGSTTASLKGLQWDFIYGHAVEMKGVQSAIVARAGDATGAQLGFINWADDIYGLQWGFVNYTKNFSGLQLGFVNYAEHIDKGLQIGLVNIIRNNGWLPVMVFVNGKF